MMFCFSRQVCKENHQYHSLHLFRADTVIILCILLEKGNYITFYWSNDYSIHGYENSA